jgi:hypothetical protein
LTLPCLTTLRLAKNVGVSGQIVLDLSTSVLHDGRRMLKWVDLLKEPVLGVQPADEVHVRALAEHDRLIAPSAGASQADE